MPVSSWVKDGRSVSQIPEQRVFNPAGLHITILFLLPGVFPHPLFYSALSET